MHHTFDQKKLLYYDDEIDTTGKFHQPCVAKRKCSWARHLPKKKSLSFISKFGLNYISAQSPSHSWRQVFKILLRSKKVKLLYEQFIYCFLKYQITSYIKNFNNLIMYIIFQTNFGNVEALKIYQAPVREVSKSRYSNVSSRETLGTSVL